MMFQILSFIMMSLVNVSGNNDVEIFYYPNHRGGAYTVSPESMTRQYEKRKCISDKKFRDEIIERISKLRLINCIDQLETCDLCVKIYRETEELIVGFDYYSNYIYINKKCYLDDQNLYMFVKKKARFFKPLPKPKN